MTQSSLLAQSRPSRRSLLKSAALGSAAAVAAPYVKDSYAAGSLSLGVWDHWVPGANATLTKEVTVGLSTAGKFDITNRSGTTDVIVDFVGYYSTGTGDPYVPVTTTRIAEFSIVKSCEVRSVGALRLAGVTRNRE